MPPEEHTACVTHAVCSASVVVFTLLLTFSPPLAPLLYPSLLSSILFCSSLASIYLYAFLAADRALTDKQ